MRLVPALPFSVLPARDTVRLVAGEDVRYTLSAPGLETWLPAFWTALDGRPLEQALEGVDAPRRDEARRLVEQLRGERVLVDAPARAAHPASGPAPHLLSQDRLDYDDALRFNRARLEAGEPWIWASTGPLQRAYVSPVFLPDAGPCLECLVRHFRGLSPAAEIYDALVEHVRAGGELRPSTFPAAGAEIVRQLVAWKTAAFAEAEPPAALYRLHVVEAASLEVSTHPVLPDPECPACR
jgi:bacteriocin biosynthesis cyclodehydratase domain-containing protein